MRRLSLGALKRDTGAYRTGRRGNYHFAGAAARRSTTSVHSMRRDSLASNPAATRASGSFSQSSAPGPAAEAAAPDAAAVDGGAAESVAEGALSGAEVAKENVIDDARAVEAAGAEAAEGPGEDAAEDAVTASGGVGGGADDEGAVALVAGV